MPECWLGNSLAVRAEDDAYAAGVASPDSMKGVHPDKHLSRHAQQWPQASALQAADVSMHSPSDHSSTPPPASCSSTQATGTHQPRPTEPLPTPHATHPRAPQPSPSAPSLDSSMPTSYPPAASRRFFARHGPPIPTSDAWALPKYQPYLAPPFRNPALAALIPIPAIPLLPPPLKRVKTSPTSRSLTDSQSTADSPRSSNPFSAGDATAPPRPHHTHPSRLPPGSRVRALNLSEGPSVPPDSDSTPAGPQQHDTRPFGPLWNASQPFAAASTRQAHTPSPPPNKLKPATTSPTPHASPSHPRLVLNPKPPALLSPSTLRSPGRNSGSCGAADSSSTITLLASMQPALQANRRPMPPILRLEDMQQRPASFPWQQLLELTQQKRQQQQQQQPETPSTAPQPLHPTSQPRPLPTPSPDDLGSSWNGRGQPSCPPAPPACSTPPPEQVPDAPPSFPAGLSAFTQMQVLQLWHKQRQHGGSSQPPLHRQPHGRQLVPQPWARGTTPNPTYPTLNSQASSGCNPTPSPPPTRSSFSPTGGISVSLRSTSAPAADPPADPRAWGHHAPTPRPPSRTSPLGKRVHPSDHSSVPTPTDPYWGEASVSELLAAAEVYGSAFLLQPAVAHRVAAIRSASHDEPPPPGPYDLPPHLLPDDLDSPYDAPGAYGRAAGPSSRHRDGAAPLPHPQRRSDGSFSKLMVPGSPPPHPSLYPTSLPPHLPHQPPLSHRALHLSRRPPSRTQDSPSHPTTFDQLLHVAETPHDRPPTPPALLHHTHFNPHFPPLPPDPHAFHPSPSSNPQPCDPSSLLASPSSSLLHDHAPSSMAPHQFPPLPLPSLSLLPPLSGDLHPLWHEDAIANGPLF